MQLLKKKEIHNSKRASMVIIAATPNEDSLTRIETDHRNNSCEDIEISSPKVTF
jgi:hypothetical protein